MPRDVWVVKLGGSLAQERHLLDWLRLLGQQGSGRVVIVPGGGPFANQVRCSQAFWEFDDEIAHRMALLAMHQYGWLFHGLVAGLEPAQGVPEVVAGLQAGKVPIWFPDAGELECAGISANWSVTSDSLAAWLADELGADHLILVKAAEIDTQDPGKLQSQDILDRAFLDWLPQKAELWICNVTEWSRVGAVL